MKEKINSEMSEKEGVVITDLLANLCAELATLFRSLSRITKTCFNIKEQLATPTLQIEENVNNEINETKENDENNN